MGNKRNVGTGEKVANEVTHTHLGVKSFPPSVDKNRLFHPRSARKRVTIITVSDYHSLAERSAYLWCVKPAQLAEMSGIQLPSSYRPAVSMALIACLSA